ncbi:Signal transduction histidine-protein kinase BaeS [Mycobacterium marinum]|uniref:sensor histidine kinase n=1 Tax=Mycobacterium marinum TaxID=1781 RepID=UPI000EDC69C2|nr:ATP-binding protein [Mycobacterium marinum]RFZ08841.1 Signal transduction histidine-protein kinase BaeS [Mycobacterium marinum]
MTTPQHSPQPVGGLAVRRGTGIGVRLLFAQTMVLVAGAATTWLVAKAVGPPLFHEHLRRAKGGPGSHEHHAEQAYRYATAISVGVALAVSALTALAVTWYLSRRLQRSVADLSAAASAVADGRYDIRVAPPHLGQDFDTLAHAFNQMAARLESVEATRRRLFGDLAHEIRTPVSVVEAYLEALEDGVKTLDAETTTMLRDQTRRLVRFSDDIAALAQAEEGQTITRVCVFPWDLISTAVASVAGRYQAKDVALTAHVGADLPWVWADPQRLGQVLGNLLDNALRHTPRQGSVDVAATIDGDLLIIRVTDTGEGITTAHLPHVFERFYRVDAARDRAHGGSGIGLAIAKALVEAHSGQITADSRGSGTGTTFTIALPAHRDVASS